ncbi:folylpolyglutamate synthase/dihydrofolate synthase family protein [Actinomadura rudentiformis]|uniref:hypothetical protein n=1 Tax=Actinomadura rudentiformis TaxID=359158 RepID=UPI001CEF6879|nr:hypothetical protein [Actinomadura rudentiformis]
MTADEVFFREWQARAAGETRSLARARALAEVLGVLPAGVPVLVVVGSKGKGTAATYASACLAAAGLRVGTVTSPGLRGNRDRIRVNGQAVSEAEFASLAERLERAIGSLPPRTGGYLAPTGLFTLSGVVQARERGADALVLEAGMGGLGDEVSLFRPEVVAITPIFSEHVGVLGDTPAAIATEKAGVVDALTRHVVSAPQTPAVAEALERTVEARTRKKGLVEYVEIADVPQEHLPPGLVQRAAQVGCSAALRLLEGEGLALPDAERLEAVLSTVVLPGRLSWHRVPGADTEVLADCAINGTGVAMALVTARERWANIDHVVLCLPDHKDLDGAIAALGALPVTFVRLPYERLRFTRPLPSSWEVIEAAELTPDRLAGLGRHVVALGTVYFIGQILDLVDADTTRLFTAP